MDLEALSKIESPTAARALAVDAIEDQLEEVRLTALEHLQKKKQNPEIVSYFISRLRDKDNRKVNRAGVALGYMKDQSAIRPLIDALVTTHEFKVTTGNGNPAACPRSSTRPPAPAAAPASAAGA